MGDASRQIERFRPAVDAAFFDALSMAATHGTAVFPWAHPDTEWRFHANDPRRGMTGPWFEVFVHTEIRVGVAVPDPMSVLVKVWLGTKELFADRASTDEAGFVGLLSVAGDAVRQAIAWHPEKFRVWLSSPRWDKDFSFQDRKNGLVRIGDSELVWTNPMKSGIYPVLSKTWFFPRPDGIGDFQSRFKDAFTDGLGAPASEADWAPPER